MKTGVRILLKIIAAIVLLATVLFFSLTRPVDYTPYEETSWYRDFRDSLQHFEWEGPETRGTLEAGWAKRNIMPAHTVPLAGYGNRGLYESVDDSLYCRSVVFREAGYTLAYVSLDLLIVPHQVVEQVNALLAQAGHPVQRVFYTATHTHSGIGGYIGGISGYFFSGKYDRSVVDHISRQVVGSIIEAAGKTAPATVGYGKATAPESVQNRLFPDGPTDATVRVLTLSTVAHGNAAIVTFSAHASSRSKQILAVSRDYPGALVDSLELRGDVDFAVFSAGAVASHSTRGQKHLHIENTGQVASRLLKKAEEALLSAQEMNGSLRYGELNIPLGAPQLRLWKDRRLRSWAFHAFMPSWPTRVTFFRIGSVQFVGTPCDFSGELVLQHLADSDTLQLNVTSFNGGYVGYIIPDAYYPLDRYEPRDMNWFGPHTGKYFTEIIQRTLGLL